VTLALNTVEDELCCTLCNDTYSQL